MFVRLSQRHVMAALIALAAIAAAAPASAQNQQPSANAVLIAKQIVQIKGVQQVTSLIVPGLIERARVSFAQTDVSLIRDLDEVANQLKKEFAGRSSEPFDLAARAYAEHFSEAELKQILTFYQSPVGQRMVVEEPKATEQSTRSVRDWADRLEHEVVERFYAEMKKRGHDM
jgi:hypothetical protein